MKQIDKSPKEALESTDNFFLNETGFNYDINKLTKWLLDNIDLPKNGPLLDLCCGDGIWSQCFQNLNGNIELHGIDISEGAILSARDRLGEPYAKNFIIGDAEINLPYSDNYFSLIFCRGAGLFNQHDLSHPGAVQVLEMWHRYLEHDGVFCGIYGSIPSMMGKYTPPEQVKLPYNKVPRKTEAVNFLGGKFNHTKESFLSPFLLSEQIEVTNYKFVNNKHVVFSKKTT